MTDTMVVCPNIGVSGDWTVEEVAPVFDSTIEYVRPRAQVIYIVGLSMGAVGIEALLSRSSLGHIAGVVMSGYEGPHRQPSTRADPGADDPRGQRRAHAPL